MHAQDKTPGTHEKAAAPMQALTPEQLRAVVGGADLPKKGQPDGTAEKEQNPDRP